MFDTVKVFNPITGVQIGTVPNKTIVKVEYSKMVTDAEGNTYNDSYIFIPIK